MSSMSFDEIVAGLKEALDADEEERVGGANSAYVLSAEDLGEAQALVEGMAGLMGSFF